MTYFLTIILEMEKYIDGSFYFILKPVDIAEEQKKKYKNYLMI